MLNRDSQTTTAHETRQENYDRTQRCDWSGANRRTLCGIPPSKIANDRIYLFNEEGVCKVIRPARELEILATNSLAVGEQLMASPAIGANALSMRPSPTRRRR